jgi:NAD+ kinase
MEPIQKLAFVVNSGKEGANELVADLVKVAQSMGVETAEIYDFPLEKGFLVGCDACCVVGGDGTLLGVVPEATREQVPVIGINRGRLGFLTTFSGGEVREDFSDLLKGEFQISYRSVLEGRIGTGETVVGLNDILVKATEHARIVHLEVYAGDELVTVYICDGLIISTPTGSTAYNLSAGGPLLQPNADVIAMTPICPHTMSNRSIIFQDDITLRVRNCHEEVNLLIAADGQRTLVLGAEPVAIRISEKKFPLAQKVGYSHFEILRTKLKWSGGYVERS